MYLVGRYKRSALRRMVCVELTFMRRNTRWFLLTATLDGWQKIMICGVRWGLKTARADLSANHDGVGRTNFDGIEKFIRNEFEKPLLG